LYVHEPEGNRVIYEDGQEEQVAKEALERKNNDLPIRNTALTRYFELNRMAILHQDANPSLYQKVLKHTYETVLHDFSYEKAHWKERTKSKKLGANTIIRLGPAPPRNKELHVFAILYYYRLLFLIF